MRHEYEDVKNNYKEEWYAIHEVFYNSKDEIVSWTQDPIEVVGDDYMTTLETLELMMKDIEKYPILDYNMKAEGKWDWDNEEEEYVEIKDINDFFKEEEDETGE